MAAMQQRGRLQPAGLYRGVGHQNPAPQPARRTTTTIHGGGYQKSTGVRSHQKQAVVQPTVRPSSWLPWRNLQETCYLQNSKATKTSHAKPVVRPRPSIQQGGYQKNVIGPQSRTKPAPHLQFRKPEGPISIPEKNHEHHEQNKVKPASSSGKVKFTEFKTSDIDAAVSKPVMRLHEMKDYSVYKSKFGAIMLPKEGASPSMEEFT
ncbi:hypothetical protein OsI_36844 [Oryza sativa Indica Group]|uniref:Uncharacterized protein n=1 Tax=Oryza sativa subsp. indica TaxID=39946 RepID=B8BLK9_ORYSI|nr:hypothetical protein OsI_36844 [Oryza sativa Indica Group]